MNCRRVDRLLSDHLEGLLSPRQARAVTAHLDGCPLCRERREQRRAVGAELRRVEALCHPPDLLDRTLEQWLTSPEMARPAQRAGFAGLKSRSVPAKSAGTDSAMAQPTTVGFVRTDRGFNPGALRRIGHARMDGKGWHPLAILGAALAGAAAIAGLHWGPLGAREPSGNTVVASRTRGAGSRNAHGTPSASWREDRRRPTGQPFQARAGDFAGVRTPVRFAANPTPKADWRPHSGSLPNTRMAAGTTTRQLDDLAKLNDDPLPEDRRWTPLPPDAWDKIEARVRQHVRVKDDFITIPFPRLASTSARPIAQAAEGYKREAAIVDPRLSHEVTCAFKATALSDLCDQLRSETGIQLSAGPSVADEKVTVFCEKLPLREVMRQLSRPFGYTWLRSKSVVGVRSSVSGSAPAPNTEHRTPNTDYRYELVQDLRSQLLEEELRNRDRDAALLDLEREIDRYQPYLGLSPDEALARSKAALPEEKPLLERLASEGWGPIHMYFQLSPQEQAALRAGQELKFAQEPDAGELSLPPDLARSVLQGARHIHLARRDGQLRHAAEDDPDGMPLTAVPEARALVTLSLRQSELGRFALAGDSGFRVSGGHPMALTGSQYGPYAIGVSPAVRQPDNATTNAALARDPALGERVTVEPQRDLTPLHPLRGYPASLPGKGESAGPASDHGSAGLRPPSPSRGGAGGGVRPEAKLTSADVLEALHRATHMPIVADFYTRLHSPETVSVKDARLFDALNQLGDTMRLRWRKEAGSPPAGYPRSAWTWLQFRSASFYDDRLKEVPNRLLARWSASRREHRTLTLDDLIEIAQLSDQQLEATSMAEGAKEWWGLAEWDIVHRARSDLRFLAQLTPAQRQAAASPTGLAFTKMSLAQQQQYIVLAFAYSMHAPNVRLEDLAGADLRVRYSLPGGFEWRAAGRPGAPERSASDLALVWAATREAALQAAQRLDPQVGPAEIAPSEPALTFLFTQGDPKTGPHATVVRASTTGTRVW